MVQTIQVPQPIIESVKSIIESTFKHGGYTHWFDGRDRTSGYVVGNNGDSLVLTDLTDWDVLSMLSYARHAKRDGIGSWVDVETGKIYLDAVQWCETLEDAISLGKRNNELAIWDLANSCELRLIY